MTAYVLHPSVAVGWWLPYHAYSDSSLSFLQNLEGGVHRGIVSADIATHVLAAIEAVEREYTRLGFPDPFPIRYSLPFLQRRFSSLRGALREERVRDIEINAVYNIHIRYRLPLQDASLVWLSIREDTPLLVADYELYAACNRPDLPFKVEVYLVSDI